VNVLRMSNYLMGKINKSMAGDRYTFILVRFGNRLFCVYIREAT